MSHVAFHRAQSLRLILWNLFYDGLLRLELPHSVQLVAFEDDVAVVTVTRNKVLLEMVSNLILDIVNSWIQSNGLQIAPHKSKAVILTRKCLVRFGEVRLGYIRLCY